MKHARIAWAGAVHETVESEGELLLTRSPWAGKRLKFDEVVWLPPLAPVPQARTILALGLNYADHAKELAFKAPEEPLVFVKGEGALIGHKALTRRPKDATHMHYECELAVVIGRTAKHVKKRKRLRLRGWLHRGQRLRHSRLFRKLVPTQLPCQEPRHLHTHWPLVGRCQRHSRHLWQPHEFEFANHGEWQDHTEWPHARHDF